LNHFLGPVGATVDHEDDPRPVSAMESIELLAELAMELADHRGFIEHWTDDVQGLQW
jgi:hypothetical protein